MSDCVGYVGPASDQMNDLLRAAQGLTLVQLGPFHVAVDARNTPALHASATSITIGMRSPSLPHAHGVEIRWDGQHVVIDADPFEQRRLYWQRVGEA